VDDCAVIGRSIPGDDGVAVAVARIASHGRAAWPAVAIADDAIAARIARLVRDDPEVPLDELHAADFYLATALAVRDAGALRAFETELVPEIQIALRRLRLSAAAIDEITQALRLELLTGDEPKIASYAGRGGLVAWLQVTATRKAFKLARHLARERPLDEVLLDHWPDPAPGPSSRHLHVTYTAALKTAIRDAFAALEVRQRNLLRQHFLDELTIDDLARMYGAHRSTCARWLADARGELTRRTRKLLIAALGLPTAELDSVLRFLDSDIELSISRILGTR
jgi:RNA polymerase sigma-70 factor (ECF subfamily)